MLLPDRPEPSSRRLGHTGVDLVQDADELVHALLADGVTPRRLQVGEDGLGRADAGPALPVSATSLPRRSVGCGSRRT